MTKSDTELRAEIKKLRRELKARERFNPDRLRAHVDHWCEQRDVEAQRAIDAEMLAEGWKAEAAALRAALASGDEEKS